METYSQRLLDALDSWRCIVIAEIGSNFPPSPTPDTLRFLIRTAVECGADAVKFQDFFPVHSVPRPQSWRAQAAPWALPPDTITCLRELCHEAGVPFGTSVFTPDACRRATANDFVKIASSESLCPTRLAALLDLPPTAPPRPIFVSFPPTASGRSLSLNSIALALAPWRPPFKPVALACLPRYPADPYNLTAWYARLMGLYPYPPIGISSHVPYPDALDMLDYVPVLPAALELHLRVPGITPDNAPDADSWSLEPAQFAEVVKAVRRREETS